MQTNLSPLVHTSIVRIASVIRKYFIKQNGCYFLFSRAAIYFIISLLILLSAPITFAQDVLMGLTSVEGPQGGGTAFTINSSGTNFTVRKGFYSLGISPFGDLTLGKDGDFYGMTSQRGKYDYGTIFKMTPAGKVTNLHHFSYSDGAGPAGNLIQATDGNFYGMTFGGGHGKGTIFKITPDGLFTILKSFDYTNDGGSPWGSLVQGKDGNFYGMTLLGGKYNYGTVFKITPTGTYTVLRSFNGTTNGGSPYGNLVQGKDGNFYGMTSTGGTYGYGTIIKVTPTGTFTVLRSLNDATDGGLPGGSLILSTDGNFYGMTFTGGKNYNGTIFKITPKGAFTVLRHLSIDDGGHPYGSLVRGSDGNFYGMTWDGGGGNHYHGTIFKLTPSGTFTVLEHFDDLKTGSNPRGSLVQGNDGNFYGMASYGPGRFGTIFKITPGGTFTLLVALPDNNEGNTPYSSLMQAKDGYYYGTTSQGGKYGAGTIFKMCPDGTFTILHSLNHNTDGANPESTLIQATDGNFYGTARTGGANGYGTIYKITPRGIFSVLHSFGLGTNGWSPSGGLVQGNDGNFYGITFQGGTSGGGTVYKITPAGTLTTIRQLSFSDGVDSKATLVKGKDGSFYGMTHFGGNASGTIFKITPTGNLSVMYNFTQASGGFPRGSLNQDAEGNFYGMTQEGGSKGYGTIFKITSSGTFTVLHNFDGTTDGSKPNGSLVRDSKGNLYGMNSEGGNNLGGTIFKLTPAGTFTVLRHLNKSTDGGAPQGSLIIQKANPVAKSQSVVTALNTTKAITLSGTGGTPLSYNILTKPKNGTLSGSGANRTYKPKPGFSGTDSFTFTVTWGCQTSAAKTITITVGDITASTIRINSGGEAVSTSLGNFQVDNYFAGNTSISTTAGSIAGTANDALYQNTRKAAVSGGSFTYNIPVTNGTYLVKLHFAEIAFTTSGRRQFNVAAEEVNWLKNYDIFVAAGGAKKAVTATKTVTVNDGVLNLNFASVIDKACVSALEIVPASGTVRVATHNELINQPALAANLYPNPVTDDITVSLQEPVAEITATITNATGAEVTSQQYPGLQNNQFKLDVRSLRPGAYILRIQTDKGQQNLKFIKQ